MKKICPISEYQKLLDNAGLLRRPLTDEGLLSVAVSHITYDSREVVPGTLFVCKGAGFKEEYLEDAMEKGAVAWISQTARKTGEGILVSDIRKTLALLAYRLYD